MAEYNLKRHKELQRDVADARQRVKICKIILSIPIIMFLVGVASIVCGNMFDLGDITAMGGGILGFEAFAIFMGGAFWLVDGDDWGKPFKDLQDAERSLEDYIDNIF